MALINIKPKREEYLVQIHLERILETMRLTLFIAKISGIFYFSRNESGRKLETSDKKKTLVFTSMFTSAYLTLILVAFKISSKIPNDGTFYTFVRNAFNVFFCVSIILQIVVGFFVKPRVTKWLNSLAANDAAMDKIGLTIDHGNVRKSFSLLFTIMVLMFILKIALFVGSFQRHWTVSLCVAFYHVIKTTFKMIVVFFMTHLQRRFEKINSAIERLADETITWCHGRDISAKLDRLCRLHFRTCHLARRLNNIASFQFFYCFSVSLGAMLFFSYYLYHSVRTLYFSQSGSQFDMIIFILFGITALTDEIIDCLFITGRCRFLCKAANETPRYLHELRYGTENHDVQWEKCIRNNCLQFLHQKVTFTALGYFDIDVAILNSMAGTIIAYLVMFIQYDQSFRELNDSNLSNATCI